jgi:sarcosine oxidase subunit beta
VDWDFFADGLAPAAAKRLPCLSETGIMKGQAGLHADTPDSMAIMGEAAGIGGLYLACGFSGHGFMHSPAVGRTMADLILKKKTTPVDASLAPERFRQPARPRETAYI